MTMKLHLVLMAFVIPTCGGFHRPGFSNRFNCHLSYRWASRTKVISANSPASPPASSSPESSPAQLDIVFEDSEYFFVNKPKGQSVVGEEGAVSYHDSVVHHSLEKYNHHPNLLHRLDKGTSGVMVYAKSVAAAKHYLSLQDIQGAITKEYVAIVNGCPPKTSGRVTGGIMKSRDMKSYIIAPGGRSGKPVLTTYRTLASFSDHPMLGNITALSLRLFTGRKHQVYNITLFI